MSDFLHLFKGYGIELEYMIVSKNNLSVNPIADKLIYEAVNEFTSDVEFGSMAWSNELVLHVIEFKTNGPAVKLNGLENSFHEQVLKANKLLEKFDSILLPTGSHPFMNPFNETKLWPYENNFIYESYNKIFDCRGHGWSNLQSIHLNLPFFNDSEFAKLHAAIRILLPIIPALCASSPILDGKPTGFMDSRLEAYRNNQNKISSISGKVIPERVYSKEDYESKILNKIYSDISPFDHEKILQHEWINSRGAIARFERNTIEIRIIDMQESPAADIAVIQFIVSAVKALIHQRWISFEEQKKWDENKLSKIFLNAIKYADDCFISDKEYLSVFGINTNKMKAIDLWRSIFDQLKSDYPFDDNSTKCLQVLFQQGSLSKRILKALKEDYSRNNLTEVYRRLSETLQKNEMFIP